MPLMDIIYLYYLRFLVIVSKIIPLSVNYFLSKTAKHNENDPEVYTISTLF